MIGLDNGRCGTRFQLRIIQQQDHIVKQRALIALQRQRVVALGKAVGQGEKAAQKRLLGLGEHSHIHRALAAAKHAAQSDHQQFVKVM
jgi:hypothetical protein